MASIRKLEICGLRSFGPAEGDEQRIQFDKPLTVIKGRNGCGKTTLIEALRYVTAQKEPIGRGVFVHDPHLTEDNGVKGFVKVLIQDVKGDSVTISKAMQATKTKTGITTKSLDCTITRKDPTTRQPISISNRCVDVTAEITRMFGVTKAILENVIFCTQDESHWPLDTDQKLKEKFDQILDSEKYNKCLNKVRDKRKKLLIEKAQAQTELKFLQENKIAATNKRKQKDKLNAELDDLKKEVFLLDEAVIPIDDKLREVYQKEVELSKVHTVRETTRTELNVTLKREVELRQKIEKDCCIFLGSDQDLDDAMEACDEKGKSSGALNAELAEIGKEEKKLTAKSRQTIGEVSQLKKLTEMNDEKTNQKQKLIGELAALLNLEGSSHALDSLERKIRSKEIDLKSLIEDQELQEESCQAEIDKARSNVFQQETVIKKKEDALNDNREECKKLKREVEDVEASQAKLERVATALRKATQDLNDHKRINNLEELKSDVRKWQTSLDEVEKQLSIVEENVSVVQEQTGVMKELEFLKGSLNDKSTDMKRLRNIHEDNLKEVLGCVPESGFKRAVEVHHDSLQRQLRDAQSAHMKKEKEVTTLEGRRKFLKESLQEKQATLTKYKEQVFDSTNGEDWTQKVQSVQRIVDELQEEKGTLMSSSLMYERYIRSLHRPKPNCPLCIRDFADEQEAIRLAEELRNRIRDVPNRIEGNKRQLDENQDKLNKLLALQSVQDRIAVLQEKEIPELTDELREIEKALSAAHKDLEILVSQKQKPEKLMVICSNIQGDMALLDQVSADYLRLKRDIEKLEMRLPAGGPKQGLRELLAEQDTLRHKRKLSHHNHSECQARLQRYHETLQTLQKDEISLSDELRLLEGAGGSRKTLEDRYCELQSLDVVLADELTAEREVLYPLKEALTRSVQDLRNLKENNKSATDAKRRELDGLRKRLDDIKRLHNETSAFLAKGTDRILRDLESEIESIESRFKQERERKEIINAQIGDNAKNIVRRRELEDNRTLRQIKAKCRQLEEKLKELEGKFGNINYDSLMKEKKKLKQEEEEIGKSKARINGRVEAISSQCTILDQELQSKMFKNIDADYKKALAGCYVSDAIAMDLFRYATCMEYAMSVYHKQQMERVNSFAREYWRKIYQGNDIEYIEIQTDECEVSEKRRNYSYRLVQVKNGVRLDMRNRCSAGQKMLACLIIRMALAEVFSGSCGILTLDEPTTNLDGKNVKTLARVLNEIIVSKQTAHHSNFQLIVITHDDAFVEELVQVNGVQSYLEVYRDSNARSKVRRHEVAP